MRTLEQWFKEYGKSHQNPANKKMHFVCVPLIMYSIFGLLDVSSQFMGMTYSLALPLVIIAGVFYLTLSWKLAVLLVLSAIAMVASFRFYPTPHFQLYSMLFVFVASWIGQFIGHKWEGAKPSFLEDIVFLLIGPLWVADHWSSGKLR